MIPLRDENPTLHRPILTIAFIAICVVVFLWQISGGPGARQTKVMQFAMIPHDVQNADLETVQILRHYPAELRARGAEYRQIRLRRGERVVRQNRRTGETWTAEVGTVAKGEEPVAKYPDPRIVEDVVRPAIPAWLTLLTSIFMHGGWMHLIGNMFFLWIFGNNIEDAMGRVRFALFYLVCGLAASFCHILADPDSTIPTLGASGAISGVLGAYLVLYPKARILTMVPLGFFLQMMRLPAALFLPIWFAMQIFGVLRPSSGGGVAWWAHIGGFVAGLVLVKLLESGEHRNRPSRAISPATNRSPFARR